MNKFVIFTAIVGGYDEILQPKVVDDRFDYILFSNDIKETKVGVWQVRPINYRNKIQTKIARWVKTHPEELLPMYECSLWIDASVIIQSNYVYERVFELYDSKILIATQVNPDFICIYQEILGMMFFQWETEKTAIEWGRFLRKEGYPRWIGTNETRLLYRIHSNQEIKKIDRIWWNCIDNYSRRDQFSFHYVIWKNNLDCEIFLPQIYGARDSEYIIINHHKNFQNKTLNKRYNLLWHYYHRHVNEKSTIENIYYWAYGRHNPYAWLNIIGLIYCIKHVILYCLGRKNNYAYGAEIQKSKLLYEKQQ